MSDWILTSGTALLGVLASVLGIYLAVVVLTRVAGLRSFSKMSSFDFAVTIAIGSVLASTIILRSVPLLEGLFALAALYAVQIVAAALRARSDAVEHVMDNEPLLLMAGQELIREHMRQAHVTESDIRAKLREANVTRMEQVRAVVLESTGDVSVLHADPDAPPLDATLLHGVRGAERLEAAGLAA